MSSLLHYRYFKLSPCKARTGRQTTTGKLSPLLSCAAFLVFPNFQGESSNCRHDIVQSRSFADLMSAKRSSSLILLRAYNYLARTRTLHRLEPPAHDSSYETEIARLARVNPEVLEIQQRSGLNKEDMKASMAQLKLLREKVLEYTEYTAGQEEQEGGE